MRSDVIGAISSNIKSINVRRNWRQVELVYGLHLTGRLKSEKHGTDKGKQRGPMK